MVLKPFLFLALLALLDSMFVGFRSAAGRNPLISKKQFVKRSLLMGLSFGLFPVLITGVCGLVILKISSDPTLVLEDYLKAVQILLKIYLPYAAIMALAFVLRLVAQSVDMRSFLSVSLFGPMTLARPFVVISGVLYALATLKSPQVAFLLLLMIGLMHGLRLGLERHFLNELLVMLHLKT